MSSISFISQFTKQIEKEAAQDRDYYANDLVGRFFHKHATLVKIIEVAALILSVGAIVAASLSFPLLSISFIATAVVGSLVACVSYFGLTTLRLALPSAHNMKNHVFKPATYGVGKLYYQGDVPILELQSDDPYKAGVAHGYLLSSQFNRILKNLDAVHVLDPQMFPMPKHVPHVLKALRSKIPQEYLKEMQGVVDGYNKWADEGFFTRRKLSLDELILIHLQPDLQHFKTRDQEKRDKQKLSVGCTVIVDKDQKEGFVFGRNMDWASLDIFGSTSLIFNRRYTGNKQSTVEVGIAGFVGTLTGMNKQGVCLAMNTCEGKTEEISGMPAGFYNRYILENSKNVDEVVAKVARSCPLGDYHLSVSDNQKALSFHFYQKDKHGSKRGDHIERTWKEGEPLIVTNCRYKGDGTMNEACNQMHSKERFSVLCRLFYSARNSLSQSALKVANIIAGGLALPYVNNSLTTHKVMMKPRSKEMRVSFDNAYAGKGPFHAVDTAKLF